MSPWAVMWMIMGVTLVVSFTLMMLQWYVWHKGRLWYLGLLNGLGIGSGVAAVAAMKGDYLMAAIWLIIIAPFFVLQMYGHWRLMKPFFQERGMRW